MTDYLRVARVDHWPKNVFLIFGHVVAIALLDIPLSASVLGWALFSLVPACLVASSNYILNEILDAPFDREHPTKKRRPVAAGTVSEPVLWAIFVLLATAGFLIAWVCFENKAYFFSLVLLFLFGLLYNVPPVRLKDRAFFDVVCESFNNPIRLWLGWYALAPTPDPPPFSIALAWWCFGGLLMTGKRFAEFRFIDDVATSGRYRKSFREYSERSLVIGMILYANLFCFCSGWAVCRFAELNNLLLVFPIVLLAIVTYFHEALTSTGAKKEPEALLRQPMLIVYTLLIITMSGMLLLASREGWFSLLQSPEGALRF